MSLIYFCSQKLVDNTIEELLKFKELFHKASNVHISQRKMSLLDSDDESLDISIQFFGLEWRQVLRRWDRVGRNIRILFDAWLQENKKVKVDMLMFADIIKSINQTVAELERHGSAVVSGQLTRDQVQCQLKIRELSINKSQELIQDSTDDSDKKCFSERLRRKSIKLNESIGKHFKYSLKRRQSQIIRNKVRTFRYKEMIFNNNFYKSSLTEPLF